MSRSIGSIAGSPFFRTAEVAAVNKSVNLVFFGDRGFLSVDNSTSLASSNPSPRNAPARKLADRLRRRLRKHPSDVLIAAPVASFYRIGKVHVLIVALAHLGISQRRLHAALSCRRVRALNGDQTQNDGAKPLLAGSDRSS